VSKYNARRVQVDGITFDSIAESVRYRQLRLLEQAGEISGLRVHPRYVLFPADGELKLRSISYVGDFEYVEKGRRVCEDVKGVETKVFRLKANLFRRLYPSVELRVVKGDRRW